MAKYIIVENDARILAQLYVFFRMRKPKEEFNLIKCNYNHNFEKNDDDNFEKKQLMKFIREEQVLQKPDIVSEEDFKDEYIIVARTVNDLLTMDTLSMFSKDDILIMDITLFDSSDEQDKNSFMDYASVRFADQLVAQKRILAQNIRFYTRSTIRSDPRVFSQQTKGKWYVPVLRPNNFSMPGGEEERNLFAKKILKEER